MAQSKKIEPAWRLCMRLFTAQRFFQFTLVINGEVNTVQSEADIFVKFAQFFIGLIVKRKGRIEAAAAFCTGAEVMEKVMGISGKIPCFTPNFAGTIHSKFVRIGKPVF